MLSSALLNDKDKHSQHMNFFNEFLDAPEEDRVAMMKYFFSLKPQKWFDQLSDIERQAIDDLYK